MIWSSLPSGSRKSTVRPPPTAWPGSDIVNTTFSAFSFSIAASRLVTRNAMCRMPGANRPNVSGRGPESLICIISIIAPSRVLCPYPTTTAGGSWPLLAITRMPRFVQYHSICFFTSKQAMAGWSIAT